MAFVYCCTTCRKTWWCKPAITLSRRVMCPACGKQLIEREYQAPLTTSEETHAGKTV